MSELATVARPYAKALIMFARENNSLESYLFEKLSISYDAAPFSIH